MLWTWRRLPRRLTAVLHLGDAPWKIALGLSLGVFISCTPFYGLHTLLAIAAAFVFRVNKVATLTGAWFNLPWFASFQLLFVVSKALFVGPPVVVPVAPAEPRGGAVVVCRAESVTARLDETP